MGGAHAPERSIFHYLTDIQVSATNALTHTTIVLLSQLVFISRLRVCGAVAYSARPDCSGSERDSSQLLVRINKDGRFVEYLVYRFTSHRQMEPGMRGSVDAGHDPARDELRGRERNLRSGSSFVFFTRRELNITTGNVTKASHACLQLLGDDLFDPTI